MQVTFGYAGKSAALVVPEDRLAGFWQGPDGVDPLALPALVREALEHPREYPPLRQVVVPGDRVVIPLGPGVPCADVILAGVLEVLQGAGVAPGDVTILAAPGPHATGTLPLPEGVTRNDHDPDDRERLAYLASTRAGRRVYLDRLLTDADVVLPIGCLAYDATLGYNGPWGAIFPGLSNRETLLHAEACALPSFPEPGDALPLLDEAAEVAWLLGSLFHLAVIPGASGVSGLIAGREDLVRDEGIRTIQSQWTLETSADPDAELVLAGVGFPGVPSTLDDLSVALQTARSLLREDGARRIVAFTSLDVVPDRPEKSVKERLDRVLEDAAVYLLSPIDPEQVEDLGMVPVDQPAEAQRLIDASRSIALLRPADRLRVARSPN